MNSELYRIVYCSRNKIKGTSKEIIQAQIALLEAARSKNRHLNITGALVSQAGVFAQVLEGPRKSVESIFSLVEHDDRNDDVTVGLRGPEAERDFPKWAMAFSDGEGPDELSPVQFAIDAVFASQDGAGENLLALLKTHFIREDNSLL
jgi:hypothetical protein